MRRDKTTLEDLLRRSKPEAPHRLVDALATRTLAGDRGRTRARAALRVAILSAAVVAGLASVGGLGYAMTFATDLVVKARSHATYAKQKRLVTLYVNAAQDQYGTTTTTTTTTTTATTTTATTTATTATSTTATTTAQTTTSGGAIGKAPALVSSSPPDGATVQSISSIELVADQYVDWTNMSVTRPDGSVTSLEDRQGTSQSWAFQATAGGLYTVGGSINANNGAGPVAISTHFTIYVPPAGGGTPQTPPPPVQATAAPTRSGDLKSADGTATVSWPAHTFGDAPAVVQAAPVAPAVVQNLPPNSLVLSVTATVVGTTTRVTTLSSVLEIQFPNAPAGAVPFVSSDASTWHAVPALSSPQLPEGQADGYLRDSGGTIHVYTRHLTFFALAPQSAATKLALSFVSPPRVWLVGHNTFALYLNLTATARVTTSWLDANGVLVPNSTRTTRTLTAGVTVLRLHVPQVHPGSYTIKLQANGIGQTATGSARIRVVATQPRPPALSTARPTGVVVVQGVQAQIGKQLPASLGARFKVTSSIASLLFSAIQSTTAAVVLDLDATPVSLVASLHAVFPELQIVALASDAVTGEAGHRAGATVVIAKPVASGTLAQTLRALLQGR